MSTKTPKRIGRPPITPGDLREKKSISLRRSTWATLEGKRRPGESLAACIDRLLSEAVSIHALPMRKGRPARPQPQEERVMFQSTPFPCGKGGRKAIAKAEVEE